MTQDVSEAAQISIKFNREKMNNRDSEDYKQPKMEWKCISVSFHQLLSTHHGEICLFIISHAYSPRFVHMFSYVFFSSPLIRPSTC